MTLSSIGIFNQTAKESEGFNSLPAGDYPVEIKAADLIASTKSAGVTNATIDVAVIAGPHAGEMEKIFYCVQHPNPEAAQIGLNGLSGLYFACGYPETQVMDDLNAELVGKRFLYHKYVNTKGVLTSGNHNRLPENIVPGPQVAQSPTFPSGANTPFVKPSQPATPGQNFPSGYAPQQFPR